MMDNDDWNDPNSAAPLNANESRSPPKIIASTTERATFFKAVAVLTLAGHDLKECCMRATSSLMPVSANAPDRAATERLGSIFTAVQSAAGRAHPEDLLADVLEGSGFTLSNTEKLIASLKFRELEDRNLARVAFEALAREHP